MSEIAFPLTPASPGKADSWLRRGARWAWQRPWLALPALALPALWPLLTMGLSRSADGALHLLRLVVLDHHLRQGMLYPRWAPELYTGLGYPVFNFYGPLSYYLAEALHLLGLDLVSALIASLVLWTLLAGFGMYRLAYDVLGSGQRWAALVAATAYMVAPYLLLNLHVRAAIAEVGAQALLPWIFWGVRRLLTDQRPAHYLLPVALALGGLAITHNITLLFTPLVLASYILVVWWQTGRARARLGWILGALAAAMGVSAFFWLPLIGERQFLAQSAYETAAFFLHENVWTWRTFLDTTFAFEYTFDVPYQLGLVQMTLALAGLIAARRYDPEWLYFLGLAILVGLGISAWSLPLWLNSEILLIAQFPWRLLTFMSIPLALFTGAILLPVRREMVRFAGACLLLGLILLANRPQVEWMQTLARAGETITLPAVSQFEVETGALGAGSAQEFRPRWSTGIVLDPASIPPTTSPTAGDRQIAVEHANAYSLAAAISSAQGGPLRFTSLYYPGWRATLADGAELATYPSTNLGLLTIDVPAGEQQVLLRWIGTGLQRAAAVLSLLTLAVLVVFVWRAGRPRWLAAAPLSLLILGLAGALIRPALLPVQASTQPVTSQSLQMAGYRLEQTGANEILIYPYWYAQQTPPAGLMVHWRLLDTEGNIVNQTAARPYFNSQKASNWPPGTLVDDAYRLGLPPGLAAGSYRLEVQIAEGEELTGWLPVGLVTVEAAAPAQPQPAHVLAARFGSELELAGFDMTHKTAAGASDPSGVLRPLTVQPGDNLAYTLYWRPLQSLQTNYHSFIHLLDHQGEALVKQDQLAGSVFRPPMLWDTVSVQPDYHLLRIPKDAASGLYWPTVGLYEFQDVTLLPVEDAAGQPLGDTMRLPPIKILGQNPSVRPQNQVDAQLGDLATLLGYDLDLPEAGLQPHGQFTLTLYYRVNAVTDQDLTQFIHLYSPDLGMAAQQDAQPQQGANPTWAWVPGEIVIDRQTLTVSDEASPGIYDLLVGLYNPVAGVRLPVTMAQGTAAPQDHVRLASLIVGDK